MGDEPTVNGWNLFQGTPTTLIVSVRKDAYGWYDPITFGALTIWQGRTVSYEGEIQVQKPLDADDVAMAFDNLSFVFGGACVCLTDSQKSAYAQWGMRLVQACPESLPNYMNFLTQLGVILSTSESNAMAAWAADVVSSGLTNGGSASSEFDSSSSSADATSSEVVEARLTVTNVVMHYVQEVASAPSVESLPADGLVAVISEVKGSEAVSVPCSWTNSFPRFAETFGSDFVAALTKPTGKIGANGVLLFVWQDYVAGTDPTDPTSKFAATIDFVDGHPVVTWSPKVEDATFPRVYRIYGKVSLNDADWTELSSNSLDGYNFFKVTVEMAGR